MRENIFWGTHEALADTPDQSAVVAGEDISALSMTTDPLPLLNGASPDGGADMNVLFLEAYQELRRLARAKLRQNQRVTLLDTTVLVHESYLRFQKMGRVEIRDRAQFLGYAARVMRFIVIDCVRQRRAERRGGGAVHVTLVTEVMEGRHDVGEDEVLRVHEVLEELAQVNPRLVQIVEMRCFAGLDELTIASALGMSDRTVRREWKKARLILKAALQ